MGYGALTGGRAEISAESQAREEGHNGPSSTCTCEKCAALRERTNIYGPQEKPEPVLPPTFTFKGASKLSTEQRADLLYLVKVGARRYSQRSFPLIWDFTDQLIRQIDGPTCDIELRRYTKRDREHILKWLHETHGKDTTAHGAESLLDLIREYERFVYPGGYEPGVQKSVKDARAEYWDSKQEPKRI